MIDFNFGSWKIKIVNWNHVIHYVSNTYTCFKVFHAIHCEQIKVENHGLNKQYLINILVYKNHGSIKL